MDFLSLMIPAILIVACGYTSYRIGRKDGAEAMINVLHHNKIISYNEKGDVRPNPLYIPED